MGGSPSNPLVPFNLTNDGENQRVKYASSTMLGLGPAMQDAHAVDLDLDATTSFFGVYDGHGGAEVAMYCAKRFHTMLLEDKDFLNNLPDAIKSVCSRIDNDLRRSNEWRESLNPRGNGNCFQFLNTGVCANLWHSAEEPYVAPLHEGSTACVVIIRGNEIIVGNVGDSRCVLSKNGQAIDLSIDHKPNVSNERERIQRAGGQVWRPIVERAVSVGDFAYKQNGNMHPSQQMVTCVPDIRVENITDDTDFLVIASDGIWDRMSSKNVGELSLRLICEKLIDHCSLWTSDNMTAILVMFKPIVGSDEVAIARTEHHQHNPVGSDEQLNIDSKDDEPLLLSLLFTPPEFLQES
uniref:protein-serine/threonine phosphatase n=1 Tax=Leersia perrieri TaxID=77586 RepID=A0A0D9VI15_9ORYZ